MVEAKARDLEAKVKAAEEKLHSTDERLKKTELRVKELETELQKQGSSDTTQLENEYENVKRDLKKSRRTCH